MGNKFFLNKKAQEFSIKTILLGVLGVIILVVLVFGFIQAWGSLKDWIPSGNNINKISMCRVACASNNLDYCTKEAGLKIKGMDFSKLSCELLSAGDYGIESCPGLCDFDNLPDAFRVDLLKKNRKLFLIGGEIHYITYLGDTKYKVESEPQNIVLTDVGDKKLVDFEGDKVPDVYLKLERVGEDSGSLNLVDLTGFFEDKEVDEDGDYFDNAFKEDVLEVERANLEPIVCCSGLCNLEEPLLVQVSETSEVNINNNLSSNQENEIRKKVIELVIESSYSTKDAEDFYKMISGLKNERNLKVFEYLAKKLSEARESYKNKDVELNYLVGWEIKTIGEWARIIKKEINYQKDYFDLPVINKEKEANCFGYAQILYFSGRAMGLEISVSGVSGLRTPEAHADNIIRFSDGTLAIIDLTDRAGLMSETFEIGKNGWKYVKENQIGRESVSVVFDIWEQNKVAGQIYLSRGTLDIENDKLDEAIKSFDKGIEYDKENPALYNNRGAIRLQKSMNKEAIEDFNKAIELNSEYDSAYQNRATALLDIGKYKEAILDYNEVIRINPDNYKAYYGRALVNLFLGNYEEAIKDFTSLIKLKPDFARAYLYRGISYASLQKNDEAKKDWQKAKELDSELKEDIDKASKTYGIKVE